MKKIENLLRPVVRSAGIYDSENEKKNLNGQIPSGEYEKELK